MGKISIGARRCPKSVIGNARVGQGARPNPSVLKPRSIDEPSWPALEAGRHLSLNALWKEAIDHGLPLWRQYPAELLPMRQSWEGTRTLARILFHGGGVRTAHGMTTIPPQSASQKQKCQCSQEQRDEVE